MTRTEMINKLCEEELIIDRATATILKRHPGLEKDFDVGEHEEDGITEEYFMLLTAEAEIEWRAREEAKPVTVKALVEVQFKMDSVYTDAMSAYCKLVSELRETSILDSKITRIELG